MRMSSIYVKYPIIWCVIKIVYSFYAPYIGHVPRLKFRNSVYIQKHLSHNFYHGTIRSNQPEQLTASLRTYHPKNCLYISREIQEALYAYLAKTHPQFCNTPLLISFNQVQTCSKKLLRVKMTQIYKLL
jgi:hypothetical protein